MNAQRQMQMILVVLVTISLAMGVFASVVDGKFEWRGLLGNLATELFGGVVTYMLIERIIGGRERDESDKKRLLSQIRSTNGAVVQLAIGELIQRGWLYDGTLESASLSHSNLFEGRLRGAVLRGANFHRATLTRASLWKADLTGARNLTEAQLASARSLQHAIMPDGQLYDGRYNLEGDLEWVREDGLDANNPEDMAKFYSVSVEAYLAGQAWARQNLAKLHGE